MPRAGDLEGQKAFRLALGMPETSDKYDFGDLSQVKGVNENYLKAARDWFHKSGLSQEQAAALVTANNAWATEQMAAQDTAYKASVAAGEQELRAEWKNGYDRMINQAGTTAKMLGISAEMIDGIESKIGYAGALKFLANLGTKLGEDSFVSLEGGNARKFAGTLTPAEAKVQWDSMKMDKDFLAALMDNTNPGHKAAREKQTNMFKLMFPET